MDRAAPTLAPTPEAPPELPPLAPLPWWQEASAYLAAVAVTVFILVVGLRLPAADFHAPFQYSEDALLILPFVKSAVERGSHWRTERLGAPGIQEMHDFPVVDHLHFAIIWALGKVFPDPVVVFNVFYLLTYPLTTLTGMFVLRRFGLSIPAAAAGGILYAFCPYHQLRAATHYFLSAYYVIPLTLMVTLWVCRGRLPFFRRTPAEGYALSLRTWDTLEAVLIAAATSAAGAYYAFFACALLACAGAYGWVVTRTWRAAASAGLVIGVIVAGGVLNHAPAFYYQYRFGHNTRPTQRWAEEAEMYGMKVIQLVLPTPGHNNVELGGKVVLDLSGVRTRYDSALRPLHQFLETEWDPLGAVAAAGYVGLLAAAVLPVRKGWPVGPLVALTLFGTLLGTVGGLGDIFNLLVTPQIRCHNRIAIYLAFLALFASCGWLDRWFRTRTGWAGRLRWPAFVGLIAFGVWDQTDVSWFPQVRPDHMRGLGADAVRERVADKFWADRRFFAAVEDLAPDGMVFCFPVEPYPETPPYEEPGSPGKVGTYEMVRGFLHTRSVRWSFGAMKGREWDGWQRAVGADPVPRMLERLVLAGFDGLLVDRRGLNPARFDRVMGELDRVLGHGSARVAHEDGTLFFFSLGAYRRDLEANYGPALFGAMAAAERTAVAWLWLKGWDCYEPVGYERRQRWCKRVGQVVLVNPTDAPKKLRVEMKLHTWFPAPVVLRIEGGDVWTDKMLLDDRGATVSRELVVPPGRHTVWFRCPPPGGWTFPDSRDLAFGVQNFSMREVP